MISTMLRHWLPLGLCFVILSTSFTPAVAQDTDTAVKVFVPYVSGEIPELTDTKVASEEISAADAQAYWTRERRANAQPYGISIYGTEFSAAKDMAIEDTGSAFLVGANEELMLETDSTQSPDAQDGTSNIYTTYMGNFYRPYNVYRPYRAIGKLYFTTWNGNDAFCTASVISPNNIVVTAAHCLYDTNNNRWHDDWVFVPNERDFAAPYGIFRYQRALVLTAFQNASNGATGRRYDVGLLRLQTNTRGFSVTSYTGWLYSSWNVSYVRSITQIGYGSNLVNGTRFTHITHAESFRSSTDVMGFGANTALGIIGSPVMHLYFPFRPANAGRYNVLIGVNSAYAGSGGGIQTNYATRFTTNNYLALCREMGCGF